MRRMAVAAALLAAAVASAAFRWPADGGSYRHGFGTYRSGFLKGMEFDASDGLVRSAGDGEIVFAWAGERLPGGFPAAGGGFAAVSHHSGLMTVYAGIIPGMDAGSPSVKAGAVLGTVPGDPIPATTIAATAAATTSAPAWARAEPDGGVLFFVYDSQERRFVNPLMVMDKLPDDKSPAIRGAALVVDGKELALGTATEVRQGSWMLLVDAIDAAPSGLAGPPFELRVLVDGSERARALYDASWAAGGLSWLFTEKPVEERSYLMADGRTRFGPLQLARGKSVVTVVAVDYAGNRREASWVLTVR